MADSAHLEKMGRELKCPICLGLLNSAASLSCNHLFCNSCITKSMKSGSQCPVCKVPFGRREIRRAPHMDNLVSIYKSMEAASGVNIFVTQNGLPPSNELDKHNKVETDSFSGKAKARRSSTAEAKKEKNFEKKSSTNQVDIEEKLSDSTALEPSFPAKKRVLVPQNLLSETPMRVDKSVVGGSSKHSELGGVKSTSATKEKISFDENGDPVFPPFFWVRERDSDEDTSESSEDDLNGSPLRLAPCFSDLKDSDDMKPNEPTNTEEMGIDSKVADVFDSEMFEWTQRACSPELFSTPEKTKARYQEIHLIEEEDRAPTSEACVPTNEKMVVSEKEKKINCKPGNGIADIKLSTPIAKSTKSQNEEKKSIRKCKRKLATSSKDEVIDEVCIDLSEIGEGLNQVEKCAATGNTVPNPKRKIGKKNKKAKFNRTAEENEVAENAPKQSIEAMENQGTRKRGRKMPTPSDDLFDNKKSEAIKKTKTLQINHCRSLRNKISGDAEVKVGKEVSMHQNQENQNENIKFPAPTGPSVNLDMTSAVEDSTKNVDSKTKILVESNCGKGLRKQKRLKRSIDDIVKVGSVNVLSESNKVAEKEIQIMKQFQDCLDSGATNLPKNTNEAPSLSKAVFLHKCNNLPAKIPCCAFCQSSTNTEASGELLHYCNGEKVAAGYSGGSNIIHSHKECTEWAPNVYFENDTAINLEKELTRSRRITCCCCGMKGAALGCYYKSCRKSFHVPCAKMVTQCRWDTDNFVMLCPLHSSSKLPNEVSGSQTQKRKKSISKGEHLVKEAEMVVQNSLSTRQTWKYPASQKWVLCCSALTDTEKEAISEFKRMTGVSESRTFGSSVTHIIASTDANGACKRTRKVLMGILEGKWILTIDWIKACLKSMKPVPEEEYEIKVDIYGIRDGPRHGRLRVLNKQPKLFNGMRFYFTGAPSNKGDLQDLVVAAGGILLHRKPVSGEEEVLPSGSLTSTFIIYSLEVTDKCNPREKTMICNRRREEAEAMASLSGARVASYSWLWDSIAACKLQSTA